MMKNYFKKMVGFIAVLLAFGQAQAQDDSDILDSLIQQIDTTAFGYGMEEDSLPTANLLIENFDAQFLVDSITANPDSTFYGTFQVTFDLLHPADFGSVQIEITKVLNNAYVLQNVLIYTSTELISEGFQIVDSVDIPIIQAITPGEYLVSVVSVTTEGGACKILTKTMFQ